LPLISFKHNTYTTYVWMYVRMNLIDCARDVDGVNPFLLKSC